MKLSFYSSTDDIRGTFCKVKSKQKHFVCFLCFVFLFTLKLTKCVPVALYHISTVVSGVLFCCGILTCVIDR